MIEDKNKEADQIELHSEDVQEVLGQQPKWILRQGIVMLGAFVFVLLVGAWFFRYPQTVEATLTLTSQTPPANIVAKTSGIISEVYVKDGQKVTRGMRLALIENPAELKDIDTLSVILGRINTALISHQSYRMPSFVLSLGALQGSYSALLLKLNSYNQFLTLNYYPQKIASQRNLLTMSNARSRNAVRQKSLVEKQYELQQNSFERYRTLHDKGLISDEDFEKAKEQLFQNELSIENARASITDNSVQQMQLSSDLMELQQQYTERLSGLTTDLKAALEQVMSEIEAWKQNYLITSPTNGIVTFTNFWACNQNVDAGKIVFSVVPKLYTLPIGKLQIQAAGAGRVKKGQQVQVYFANFPENEFGMVRGVVKQISLIPDAEGNYIVEVGFPVGLKTTYGRILPLSLEMSATAKIVTEETCLLEQLFLPIKQIFANNL